MEPKQCKAARELLGWTQAVLAKESGTHINTVNNLEAGQDVKMSTVRKIEEAFEQAGVEFKDGCICKKR